LTTFFSFSAISHITNFPFPHEIVLVVCWAWVETQVPHEEEHKRKEINKEVARKEVVGERQLRRRQKRVLDITGGPAGLDQVVKKIKKDATEFSTKESTQL
jgi:hypothetical protein